MSAPVSAVEPFVTTPPWDRKTPNLSWPDIPAKLVTDPAAPAIETPSPIWLAIKMSPLRSVELPLTTEPPSSRTTPVEVENIPARLVTDPAAPAIETPMLLP